MLQGINILDFFENIEDTRFETADVRDFIVSFQTNNVPGIIVAIKGSIASGTIKLLSKSDNSELVSAAMVVLESNGYTVLSYNGQTLTNQNDGYYYFKISIPGVDYYSEVFSWCSNFSNLLKIQVDTADITMFGNVAIPTSNFINTYYLFYNGINIESQINEEGVEKPYGDIAVFNTLNINRKININGNDQIFRFLSSLRIFKVNGTITLTVKGKTKEIYDTVVEINSSDSFDETMIIDMTYKETDFISSRNEI